MSAEKMHSMAEITRKRTGELQRGVFRILLDREDGLRAKDVIALLEREVPPTDFENSTYPKRPDVRRYGKIVRFSTIGPVKAGWMLKSKGTWSLTDEGRKAYDKFPDPEQFALEARRLYREWKKDQPEEAPTEEPDESEGGTLLEEAEEGAWSEIESYLHDMHPYDFQNMVAALIRAMGYHVSWVAPPGPDRGIDIVAHPDPLGVEDPRIKVQVKRQQGAVTATGLRSFLAVLGDSDVGLFVSLGGFTKDAEIEARTQEKRRMILIDIKRMFDLWVEHYDRIPEEQRALLPLRPVHYLAPRA
jgi:restriction system protein